MKRAHRNHLLDLLAALVEARVKFIVCGGVAAVLHGVERMTMDLDVSVKLDGENLDRFAQALGSCGLKSRVPIDMDRLADPAFVRRIVEEKGALVLSFTDPDEPFKQVDMFLTDKLSYEALLPDAVQLALGGIRVPTLSARRLLAIKKAVSPLRDKDRLDIAALELILEKEHGKRQA